LLGFRQPPAPFWGVDDDIASWKDTMVFEAESVPIHDGLRQPDFDTLLQETLPLFDIDPAKIPQAFRQKVQRYVYDYAVTQRSEMQAMLYRGAPYLPLIKRLLTQHNLPTYFAYIPLAESAFYADAAHPESGAVGLWQLMPSTARAYGLQVTEMVDERRDPFLSTRAAVRYLQELQNIFGKKTPLLILAAYNYGENNLSKAIVRARTRNIWSLLRKRQIPVQTRQYLVKMIALWIVCSHTGRYDLDPMQTVSSAVAPFAEIMFPRPVTVGFIAHQIALPEGQVRRMNPQLLHRLIPAHTSVRIPASSVDAFVRFEVRLTSPISAEQCCARLMVTDTCMHTVEEGESAFSISRQYAISLETLKAINQLEGSNPIIRPGQSLAVCDVPQPPKTVNSKIW
jgi:membrane-bound lytic murein transglycosylase D